MWYQDYGEIVPGKRSGNSLIFNNSTNRLIG